jgi:YD repeat-containing protein
LLTSTDELGRVIANAYDANGNLTSVTDGEGFVTTMVVNGNGLVTSITTPDPDDTGPQTAATTSMAYDANGRMTTLTNPDSTTIVHAYDAADNVTSITNELGNAMTFVYDSLDRLTNSTDREGATTSFSYDSVGQLVTETDALGNATDFEYNSRRWLEKQELPDPDGAGPLGRPEYTFVYDAAGNVIEEVEPQFASGIKREYEYDEEGNLIEQTHTASGDVKEFTWGHRNQLKRVATRDNLGVLVHDVTYTHDVWGRRISTTVDDDGAGPNAVETHGFMHDKLQRIVEFIDGSISKRQLSADAVDEVLAEEDVANLSSTGTMEWLLADGAGSVRDVVDSNGQVTNHIAFGAFGEIVSETSSSADHWLSFGGAEIDRATGLQAVGGKPYSGETGRRLGQTNVRGTNGNTNAYRRGLSQRSGFSQF